MLYSSFKDMVLLGLGTVHIWTGTSTGIGTWNSVPVPNGTFFRYFTLCVITNIYFSEKISPKLSISTFWTIGPYTFFNFFSSRIFCFIFSNNQMKAWNIYLFLIKWKWNPFIFLANKQRFTVKIKVIIVLNFLNLFHFNIVFKFAIKFSLVFISFIHIFVSFSLVFILWTHFYLVFIYSFSLF